MEEKNTFKIGDVVILKSGGPNMTIVGINEKDNNYVEVSWYEHGTHQFQWNSFNFRALEAAPKNF